MIEPRQRARESTNQHDFAIIAPLRRRAIVSDVGTEDCFPAAVAEQAEALLFELVFGDHGGSAK